MKNKFNLIVTFLSIFLVSSCGGSKKDNFDFSNIKLPRNIATDEKSKEKTNNEKNIEIVKNELKPLKDKKEIKDSMKFGKKDPFSIGQLNSNSTISKIKLKGFISMDNKNYAMISYIDNEGAVSLESKGGVTTNLLPTGTTIKDINPIKRYIIINFEDEIYTLSL